MKQYKHIPKEFRSLPVLSVKDKNAYAILFGMKDIENRNWKINEDKLGTMLLHISGRTFDVDSLVEVLPQDIAEEVVNHEDLYSDALDFVIEKMEAETEGLYIRDEDSGVEILNKEHEERIAQAVLKKMKLTDKEIQANRPYAYDALQYFMRLRFFPETYFDVSEDKGSVKMIAGCIAGVFDVTACKKTSDSLWADSKDGYYWSINNIRLFLRPTAMKGKLGLWNLQT